MMKRRWTLILLAVALAQTASAYNYISWQAQQGEFDYWNYIGAEVDDVPGIVNGFVKGPAMTEYLPMGWDAGRTQWYNRLFYDTPADLQQNALGTWMIKFVYSDASESIYTFAVTGTLEESDFPPVPVIQQPAEGASDIIAEHCTFLWDPNHADASASLLGLEAGGDNFFYSLYTPAVSMTSWNPGWLETGDAYFRITYLIDHTGDMAVFPSLVSGPEITWHFIRAYVGSGMQNDFSVKYSLDLNEDDRIDLGDLGDLTILCSHWMETKE